MTKSAEAMRRALTTTFPTIDLAGWAVRRSGKFNIRYECRILAAGERSHPGAYIKRLLKVVHDAGGDARGDGKQWLQ